MNCLKRQKIVKRDSQGSVTSFRCLKNNEIVTDDICDSCALKIVKHVKPCEKKFLNKAVINPPDYPSLSVQLVSWARSVEKWRKAGRPKRSDTQVKTILEICKTCSWYDPNKIGRASCRERV